MEIALRVVKLWSEIKLVITNRTPASRSCYFVITRLISDQIALHSVQLPLLITPPARRAWRSYKFASLDFSGGGGFGVESRATAHGLYRCAVYRLLSEPMSTRLLNGIRTRTSSKRRFSKYVILDYDIALKIQFVDAEILSSFVSSVVYAGCLIVVAAFDSPDLLRSFVNFFSKFFPF